MTMASDQPVFTLGEFSKRVEGTYGMTAQNVAESLMKPNELLDGYVPLTTRRERCLARIADWKCRAKDIWTILRGGDVHEDCGR